MCNYSDPWGLKEIGPFEFCTFFASTCGATNWESWDKWLFGSGGKSDADKAKCGMLVGTAALDAVAGAMLGGAFVKAAAVPGLLPAIRRGILNLAESAAGAKALSAAEAGDFSLAKKFLQGQFVGLAWGSAGAGEGPDAWDYLGMVVPFLSFANDLKKLNANGCIPWPD